MQDEEPEEGRDWSGFLTGLAIGAAAGAALVLLFGPGTGDDTRRIIRRKARSLERHASASWLEAREAARKAWRKRRKELRARLADAADRAGDVLEDAGERMRG